MEGVLDSEHPIIAIVDRARLRLFEVGGEQLSELLTCHTVPPIPSSKRGITRISDSVVSVCCESGDVYMHDLSLNRSRGTLKRALGAPTHATQSAYFPRYSLLAYGAHDGKIRIWRMQMNIEGEYDFEFVSEIVQSTSSSAWIDCVRCDSDIWPDRLLTGSRDFSGRVWDIERQELIAEFPSHPNDVYGINVNPDGSLIATASWGRRVRLWDARTFEKVNEMKGPDYISSSFWPRHGNEHIFVCGGMSRIILCDIRMFQDTLRTWPGAGTYHRTCEVAESLFATSTTRKAECAIWNYEGKRIHSAKLELSGNALCLISSGGSNSAKDELERIQFLQEFDFFCGGSTVLTFFSYSGEGRAIAVPGIWSC